MKRSHHHRTTQIACPIADEPKYDVPGNIGMVALPGEGLHWSFVGTSVTAKARHASADGGWSMVEMSLAPRCGGPAPHYHKVKTETIYVLSGWLVFVAEGQEMVLSAGATVLVKPGAVHTYWNMGADDVRMLVIASPLGFEGYYDEMAARSHRERHWPPADRAEFLAMLAQYDHYPVGE